MKECHPERSEGYKLYSSLYSEWHILGYAQNDGGMLSWTKWRI